MNKEEIINNLNRVNVYSFSGDSYVSTNDYRKLLITLLDIKNYAQEVIKEHKNGEYDVSTVELAIKEHKENIENILNIVNKTIGENND